jgi:hypothetical protein
MSKLRNVFRVCLYPGRKSSYLRSWFTGLEGVEEMLFFLIVVVDGACLSYKNYQSRGLLIETRRVYMSTCEFGTDISSIMLTGQRPGKELAQNAMRID